MVPLLHQHQLHKQRSVVRPFWVINLSFDDDGAAVLAEVTEDLAASGGQLAVVLDGKVISAPAVQEAITEGDVSFSGGFTEDQARSIEMIVSSGSLPVSLTFMQMCCRRTVAWARGAHTGRLCSCSGCNTDNRFVVGVLSRSCLAGAWFGCRLYPRVDWWKRSSFKSGCIARNVTGVGRCGSYSSYNECWVTSFRLEAF